MSISKTRSALYKTARILGDVDAVKKGKVGKRVKNRLLGKLTGKLLKKLGMVAVVLLLGACGGQSGQNKLGLFGDSEYKNPHMPAAEAQLYGEAQERLSDADALMQSYAVSKNEERLAELAKLCGELEYTYDGSEMDAEGRRESMLLQARTDSMRTAIETMLGGELEHMKFPCLSQSDLLIEKATTWPVYLQKGTQLHYNLATGGNVTMRIINADARQIMKTYVGKKQLRDSLAIKNSAVYLLELTPKGTAYIDLDVSQRYSDVRQMHEKKNIRVDTVDCSAGDFMAVKLQGIETKSLFEEPRKATLRSVGKAFFGGSSRAVITLNVPRGCTDLLYSLRISTNEGSVSSDGEFGDRVTKSYKKVKFLGLPLYETNKSHSNLFRELLYGNVPAREEEAYCNVYVFTNQAEAKKFQDGQAPANLKYNIDLSLMGTQSCNGRIPTKGLTKVYLGFDNERFRYSNYLWLEVLSVTPKAEYYRVKYTAE